MAFEKWSFLVFLLVLGALALVGVRLASWKQWAGWLFLFAILALPILIDPQ
jgi:hypothetical protein